MHVLEMKDPNVGNLSIVLINDESADITTFAFTSPTGYFDEQIKNHPNGVAYAIASTIMMDDFYLNKDLMNIEAQVEPETTYWTS